MAWIHTIGDAEAQGRLARQFAAARQRAGRVYGIVRLMSLQPEVLAASMGFYQALVLDPRSPLPRWFREVIAVTVSRLNHCHY